MYTKKQIQALHQDNFDFSKFDWEEAKEVLLDALHGTPSGLKALLRMGIPPRHLHVVYSMARGRPIVGDRGIEAYNTEIPIKPHDIKKVLSYFKEGAAYEIRAEIDNEEYDAYTQAIRAERALKADKERVRRANLGPVAKFFDPLVRAYRWLFK